MLSLSSSVGASTSGAALDLALSDRSGFLYVLNGGSSTNIVGFEVHGDGSLSQVTSTTTFAGSAAGLAAT